MREQNDKREVRRWLAFVVVLGIVAAACATGEDVISTTATSAPGTTVGSGAEDTTPTETTAPVSSEPFKFVVSNNFLGNDWRPQVLRLAELTAELPPFQGRVEVEVVNAEGTVEAHNQSLNNILQTDPDVIILIASSDSAQDETVERACERGIVVITIAGPIGAPCAWNVSQDFGAGQEVLGQWMTQTLGNDGSVFVDRGIPGLGVAEEIRDGFVDNLGDGITIAGEYDGEFAPGPTQQGISALLVGTPGVSGVHTQGYCIPAFSALTQAGLDAVPATCFGYNGELTACGDVGIECAVMSGSPVVIQLAMELALDILDGRPAPEPGLIPMGTTVWITNFDTASLEVADDIELRGLVEGVDYFPDLAPGLSMPYTLERYPITVDQALGN